MEEELAGAFELYAELFAEKLQNALRQNYPYAPGFNNARPPIGSANKISGGVPEGYNTNLVDSVQATYNVGAQQVEVFMNDYWQYVNDGRRPGTYAPIRPLMLWAMSRLGLQGQEAKSAAFGISRNLYKFGIKPTYFFDIAIEQLSAQIDEELYEQLGLSIDDFLNQLIQNAIPANPNINIQVV